MFHMTIIIVLIFCAFGNGKPLQNSTDSDDMAKYFSPRIVGGSNAPEGFAPHMAALLVGHHYTGLVCGGSIVSSKVILTAAHCIDMFVMWGELLKSFHAVIGSNRWDRGTIVEFKAFHVHPKWDWQTIKNDIGFLIPHKEITMSSTMSPIPVKFDWVEGKHPCHVTGWGLLGTWPVDIIPKNLQLLHKHTIANEDCAQALAEAAVTEGYVPPFDPKIEICTFHSVGHGMCNGDSGSGLVHTETTSLVGIVSWGFACARGFPDMFVRVSAYADYFNQIVSLYE